jgi:site-specific recombinase XerD
MRTIGVDPLHVTADHVKVYKAALRDAGRSPATIARKLSVLRGVYRQFAEKGLVPWDVVQDIAAVTAPKVQKNTTPALTEQQAIRLLHAPDTSTLRGIRDRAILHAFFITACRVSAVVTARIGDLEFDGVDHFLHVVEKRGKRQRKILLDAARSILTYVDAAGIGHDKEGPLFRPFAQDGKALLRQPLHRASFWRLVKRYCHVAGIDPDRLGARGVGVHSLRKTAINNAIQNGASLHEAREFAGHSDIRTTELYFVRRDEDAERAARRIAIR